MLLVLVSVVIVMTLVFIVMFVATTPYGTAPPNRAGPSLLSGRSGRHDPQRTALRRLFDQIRDGVIDLAQVSGDGSTTYLPLHVTVVAPPEDAELLLAYELELHEDLNKYFTEQSWAHRWELRGRLHADVEASETMPPRTVAVRFGQRNQWPAPAAHTQLGPAGNRPPQPCLSPVRGDGIPILRVGPKGARIGRDSVCDLVISSPRVSGQHATIHPLDAGGWEIVDLESTNGTFVNGARIERARLSEGDQIGFGPDVVMRWSAAGQVSGRTEPG